MKREKLLCALVVVALLSLACGLPVTIQFPNQPTPKTPTLTPTVSMPVTEAPPISSTELPFDLSWEDQSIFQPGLASGYALQDDRLEGASRYHLAFSLSDPPTRVRGLEQIRYTNQEDVVLDRVELALFPELLGGGIIIETTRIDGESVQATTRTGFLQLPLDPPLQPGESTILEIAFEIQVPSNGEASYYGIFGYNGGILSLAHAYPTILVYNEEGWNDLAPDLDGDPLFSDASFYVVSVDAPADLVLVASGTEIQRDTRGDRQRVVYVNGPARDFYLTASRDLQLQSSRVDGITLNSYTLASAESFSSIVLDAAEKAISLFADLYGPYPYSEFDISPIRTSAGGVEYPGMTVVTSSTYNSYSTEFLELVVVHEIAHQWFYNLVGNDTQDQPWLDESLAEFLTWEYYRRYSGSEAAGIFETQERGWWHSAADPDQVIGLPVSAYSSADYGAIVYGKGPFFFDALRDRIGQEPFDALMRAYVERYSWDVASTAGFQALAEETCGCSLADLFSTWISP